MQEKQISEAPLIDVITPSLPKGGGSVQGMTGTFEQFASTGEAAITIPLPTNSIRKGHQLAVRLSSHQNNGLFGLGGELTLPFIQRNTQRHRPTYTKTDTFWIPSIGEIVPQGAVVEKEKHGQKWQVQCFKPRNDTSNARIEQWEREGHQFWQVIEADGTISIYGVSESARIVDPVDELREFAWYLEEQVSLKGEHVQYCYVRDAEANSSTSVPYLKRIRWGNNIPDTQPWVGGEGQPDNIEWYFELVMDYGEHDDLSNGTPAYEGTLTLEKRKDKTFQYRAGFEIITSRLCRRAILFHHVNAQIVPVSAVCFEYDLSPYAAQVSSITTVYYRKDGESYHIGSLPPLEVSWEAFPLHSAVFSELDFGGQGLNSDQYQLVDLYGDGISGVLTREGGVYHYRRVASIRKTDNSYDVSYEEPTPVMGANGGVLKDIDGDGFLEYEIPDGPAKGFFHQGELGKWSGFVPYNALPAEYSNKHALYIDATGSGRPDLMMLGPRSIRVFPSLGAEGYGEPIIASGLSELPSFSYSPTDLVAFSDVIGSGDQHIVRVAYGRVHCWPNLGYGRWGSCKTWPLDMPSEISSEDFNSQYLYLADLDGLGAADIIYAAPQGLYIWRNRTGNGFDAPQCFSWPEGFQWDQLCQLSLSDLFGTGTTCLLLSQRSPSLRHWVMDFCQGRKPHLMTGMNNNTGSDTKLEYGSSVHEWLNQQLNKDKRNELPFPVIVLKKSTVTDEVTSNRVVQTWRYFNGRYDHREKRVMGFGRVEITNSEQAVNVVPLKQVQWFHTGKEEDDTLLGTYDGDNKASHLSGTLLTTKRGQLPADKHEQYICIAGRLLRSESYSLVNGEQSLHPLLVVQSRYQVKRLYAGSSYSMNRVDMIEQVTWRYEEDPCDPQCQHLLHGNIDEYGFVGKELDIRYPRRQGNSMYYDRAQDILHAVMQDKHWQHFDSNGHWRLGVPISEASYSVTGMAEKEDGHLYRHEEFEIGAIDRTLIGWRKYCYASSQDGESPLPEGAADPQSLLRQVLDAELTEEMVSQLANKMPQTISELKALLTTTGGFLYADNLYWKQSTVAVYSGESHWYRLCRHISPFGGVTQYDYDARNLFITKVSDAVGNVTKVEYDEITLEPRLIEDCNSNIHEVAFDVFGAPRATSFRGTEYGKAVGFGDIAAHEPVSLEKALSEPEYAIGSVAQVNVTDHHSWMGHLHRNTLIEQGVTDQSWNQLVSKRIVTTDGYVRLAGRKVTSLADLPIPNEEGAKVLSALQAVKRQPIHTLNLTATEYPKAGTQCQIRQTLAYFDGFGREVQKKLRAEEGKSWQFSNGWMVTDEEGKPVEVNSEVRWLTSGWVEYNSQGDPFRVYSPFYLDSVAFIRPGAREFPGPSTLHYYDSVGRETKVVLPAGYERRTSYYPWYIQKEDENDTYHEVLNRQS
ncbi:TPA: SpvB/TcaC N-terminal domain-containing protein [Vibrio vulnificus]|nr:hypothetical protein [Vibrio vulnificus]HDU8731587.1 hypothetical protein [Vibrio vulnificus]HDU8768326.1 hypothetical protein [Vibrio vulnificus]